MKSKAEESGVKSEEEGEIDDRDDDSDHGKSKKNTTRQSHQFDNDIYAEDDDDDDDDYRSSANRRKQANASKQKETEHSKSLQLLVEGRKKKQGNFSNDKQPGDFSGIESREVHIDVVLPSSPSLKIEKKDRPIHVDVRFPRWQTARISD